MRVSTIPTPVGRPHRDIAPGTVVVPCVRQDVVLMTAKSTDGKRLLINLNTGFALDTPAADNLDVMGFISFPDARVVFE